MWINGLVDISGLVYITNPLFSVVHIIWNYWHIFLALSLFTLNLLVPLTLKKTFFYDT